MLNKPVGVIGSGSFGTAIANLLAEKNPVLLYTRRKEVFDLIVETRSSGKYALHENIIPTMDTLDIAEKCDVIFPMVPSKYFREMIQSFSPRFKPSHILIHGTKGLDDTLSGKKKISKRNPLSRNHIRTMSEVILEESSVIRVGCIAGPNLSREIADHKPAAAVIASHFDEVIDVGYKLLKSDRFLVYGSKDLVGIELCGVLKNIIAIGAGAIAGLNLGENAKAMLISRGLVEMIHVGKVLGGNAQAFLGLAGIGDLIATCSTQQSRNFTVGFRLAQGETLDQILQSMDEVAEGVNSIEIVKTLAKTYHIRCPITETLHKVMHGQMNMYEAHNFFMKFPFRSDIDFL